MAIPVIDEALSFFQSIIVSAPTPIKFIIFLLIAGLFLGVLNLIIFMFHIDTVILKPSECIDTQQGIVNYTYNLDGINPYDMLQLTGCINSKSNLTCVCEMFPNPVYNTSNPNETLYKWFMPCTDPSNSYQFLLGANWINLHPELLNGCQYEQFHPTNTTTISYIGYCYKQLFPDTSAVEDIEKAERCRNAGFDILVLIDPLNFWAFSLLFMLSMFAVDWYFKLGILH